jgi:CDP-paratose 2-epimerase
MEAIGRFEELLGTTLKTEYVDRARVGDHICYISNLHAFKRDYPSWEVSRKIDDIFQELAAAAKTL